MSPRAKKPVANTSSAHSASAAAVQANLRRVIRHARLPIIHRRVMTESGTYLDQSAYSTLLSIELMQEASLSDLASEMLLDITTVSRQIRRLEDVGLVERSVHPDDRRVSVVRNTDAGQDVAERIGAAWQRAFSEALHDWSDDEIDALAANLDRLAVALRNFAE